MIRPLQAMLLLCCLACSSTDGEERILYERQSAYNEVLVSENSDGLRILRFQRGGARQSVVKPGDPDHLELSYARAMPIGLALAKQRQRVLIVGLGGGTLPMLFRKHFPQLQIDNVELDPEVVHVAKEYFGFREDPAMRAYVGDGRAFIEKQRGRYDIIFLDAFSADSIPYSLSTREFLQSVRQALKPNGLVVSNIWSRVSNPLYDSMIRTYQDSFAEVHVVDIKDAGNKLVLGFVAQQDLDREQAIKLAETMSNRLRLRYPLGKLVKYGFRSPGEDGQEGRILLDADHP